MEKRKIDVTVEDTEELPDEGSPGAEGVEENQPDNDVSPEEETPQEETPEQAADEDEPVNELELLRQEAALARDRMLRAAAEFENYKKRAERDKQEYSKYVAEAFVLDLLPVLDNLERTLASATDESSNESIREGVSMIHQQLVGILEKRNVQKIDASEQPFDPTYHEAMAKLPSEQPENNVIEVFQHGYLLHERVIRPARVVVSQGPASDSKE